LFVSVFSYTTLMDRHIFAIPAEIIKSIIGVWIIYQIGTWYNLEDFFSGGTILITMYLGISLSLTFYFIVFEKIRNEKDISITI
ncbi:hypothetical protein OAU89_03500, partial [bacterium]|nr:hypothetical protein [bacterium]